MGEYIKEIKNRRSIYNISSESPLADEEITRLVEEILQACPTAYNMQSSKLVLLFGDGHKKLWEIVMETLRKIVPAENFARTEKKINSFAAGHGTVLYFDDTEITESYARQFAESADNFPIWAQQQNGMLQFAVWTALEAEGLGASLQHYNPIIDDQVKSTWGLPASWKLIAQMPFGAITAPAGEKESLPLEERMKVF